MMASSMTTDPMCPQCGGDLVRVRTQHHGSDADGTIRMIRRCRNEGLFFGRDGDGSWSIPATPLDPRDALSATG
jgi:hypothetical protein